MMTVSRGWTVIGGARVFVELEESGHVRIASNDAGGYSDGGTTAHGAKPPDGESLRRAVAYVSGRCIPELPPWKLEA